MTGTVVDDARTCLADDSFPSNSDAERPNFEPPGFFLKNWGVDRLSFSFPIYGHDHFADIWHRGRTRSPGDTRWRLVDWVQVPLDPESPDKKPPSLYVEVFRLPGDLLYSARLEFNPSRVLDPHGVSLCSVVDLPYAVGRAWDIAGTVVHLDCDLAQGRIRRLDVARDFVGVRSLAPYLTAWPRIASPYARFSRLEHDPRTGHPQTLYKGTGTGGRTATYDKYAESPTTAMPGAVRFEVQANAPWCRTIAGIERIEDLSTSSILDLLHDRWVWSGCATPISGQSAFTQRVESLTDKNGEPWSETKKDGFVGHQRRAREGVAKELPKGRKADYNKALLWTGVPSIPELTGTVRDHEVAYLDFETGREVIHAAI